jgi:hypothetical protein
MSDPKPKATMTTAERWQPVVAAILTAPPEKRTEAAAKLDDLKKEVAKGDKAEDTTLAILLKGLLGLVPTAVTAVAPILWAIAGPVTKFILESSLSDLMPSGSSSSDGYASTTSSSSSYSQTQNLSSLGGWKLGGRKYAVLGGSNSAIDSIQPAHTNTNMLVWTVVAVIIIASVSLIFIGSIDKIGLKLSVVDLGPPVLAAVGIAAIAFFAIDAHLADRALQRVALLDISRTNSQLHRINNTLLCIKFKQSGRDHA